MAPYSPPTGGPRRQTAPGLQREHRRLFSRVIEAAHAVSDAERSPSIPNTSKPRADLAHSSKSARRRNSLLTNGTDEAIQVLVNTYVDDGDEVLILRPSYAMYRFYSEVAGARFASSSTAEPISFPIDELLDAIRPQTRILICRIRITPPAPASARRDRLRSSNARPMQRCSSTRRTSSSAESPRCGWIASIRTCSSAAHFRRSTAWPPCVRLYLFEQADNVAWMRKAQSPYSVNMLAAMAARAAVKDT
jgi:histidinol-phosphate aminotransferase